MRYNNMPLNGEETIVREVEDVLDKVPYSDKFRQFNRKNNVKVAALYSIYLQGKSLAYIAKILYKGRFTRQSLYDVFRVRGYKLRERRLRPAKKYKGVIYRLANGGYRSRIGGTTKFLHRVIWEEHNGQIPPDHYIIFKDGNADNIVIENLHLIRSLEAKKQYNHANQNGYKRFPDKGVFGLSLLNDL